MYALCRSQQYVAIVGGTRVHSGQYTTGLSVLPAAGGVEDQSVRLMAFFDSFLVGDRRGFGVDLNS